MHINFVGKPILFQTQTSLFTKSVSNKSQNKLSRWYTLPECTEHLEESVHFTPYYWTRRGALPYLPELWEIKMQTLTQLDSYNSNNNQKKKENVHK